MFPAGAGIETPPQSASLGLQALEEPTMTTTYITIGETTYCLTSDSARAEARAALRDAGIESAPVYVGEPDGSGDSYKNGEILFAANESAQS